MKDFDFDELDRAVSSVLSKKEPAPTDQAATNVPVADTPTDDQATAPVATDTEHSDEEHEPANEPEQQDDTASHDEPSDMEADSVEHHENASSDETQIAVNANSHEDAHAESEPVMPTEPSTADPVDESPVEEPAIEEPSDTKELAERPASALAAIPVKRGRFMDMVAPSADSAKKPMPTRSEVKIVPSADFAADAANQQKDESPTEPSTASEQTLTDQVAISDEIASQDVPETAEPAETNTTSEQPADQEPSTMSAVSDTPDTTEAMTPAPSDAEVTGGVSPFIPDAPVEKRPLGQPSSPVAPTEITSPTESAADDDTATPVPVSAGVDDPALSNTNIPKEFNQEIMAVEANETVGEAESTGAPATSVAAAAGDVHPLFDTTSIARSGTGHHGMSKTAWLVVGGSLFVVGAALGVLYFLSLQS